MLHISFQTLKKYKRQVLKYKRQVKCTLKSTNAKFKKYKRQVLKYTIKHCTLFVKSIILKCTLFEIIMDLDIKKHYPKDWIVLQNRVVNVIEACHLMKSVYLSCTLWQEPQKYQAMTLFLYHRVIFKGMWH
jgi:hypothetical protein